MIEGRGISLRNVYTLMHLMQRVRYSLASMRNKRATTKTKNGSPKIEKKRKRKNKHIELRPN